MFLLTVPVCSVVAKEKLVTIAFDDPQVSPSAAFYMWDYFSDGTADIHFSDLTGGGFTADGPVQKFVSSPGLQGSIIDGPEVRVDFESNEDNIRQIEFPFSFGFALNTDDYIRVAVHISAFSTKGHLLGVRTASAVKDSRFTFSEGIAYINRPPFFYHPVDYMLIDFQHGGEADRYFIDNFRYLQSVPEISTWANLLIGLAFIGLSVRRGKRLQRPCLS
jgi:hypothetical protein